MSKSLSWIYAQLGDCKYEKISYNILSFAIISSDKHTIVYWCGSSNPWYLSAITLSSSEMIGHRWL